MQKWRKTLERRGMEVRRGKAEFTHLKEREGEMVRLQAEAVNEHAFR